MHVIVPSGNEDAVVWLQDEVVADVVDDDCFVDVSPQQTQVLHQEWPILTCVLSVQPVLDVVANVDLINHLVSVLLQSCCENYNLVVLCHRLDELDATWSHKEKAIILVLKRDKLIRQVVVNLPRHCGLESHQGPGPVCR